MGNGRTSFNPPPRPRRVPRLAKNGSSCMFVCLPACKARSKPCRPLYKHARSMGVVEEGAIIAATQLLRFRQDHQPYVCLPESTGYETGTPRQVQGRPKGPRMGNGRANVVAEVSCPKTASTAAERGTGGRGGGMAERKDAEVSCGVSRQKLG